MILLNVNNPGGRRYGEEGAVARWTQAATVSAWDARAPTWLRRAAPLAPSASTASTLAYAAHRTTAKARQATGGGMTISARTKGYAYPSFYPDVSEFCRIVAASS